MLFTGKASMCMLLKSGVQSFTALLVVPVTLHLPCVGPQDWDAQLHPRVCLCLFLPFPPRSPQTELPTWSLFFFKLDHFLFLPDDVWIFLTALVVQESFCQFPVSFQWELFHMQMYFWCVCGGKWVPYSLTPPFLINLLKGLFIYIFIIMHVLGGLAGHSTYHRFSD